MKFSRFPALVVGLIVGWSRLPKVRNSARLSLIWESAARCLQMRSLYFLLFGVGARPALTLLSPSPISVALHPACAAALWSLGP